MCPCVKRGSNTLYSQHLFKRQQDHVAASFRQIVPGRGHGVTESCKNHAGIALTPRSCTGAPNPAKHRCACGRNLATDGRLPRPETCAGRGEAGRAPWRQRGQPEEKNETAGRNPAVVRRVIAPPGGGNCQECGTWAQGPKNYSMGAGPPGTPLAVVSTVQPGSPPWRVGGPRNAWPRPCRLPPCDRPLRHGGTAAARPP